MASSTDIALRKDNMVSTTAVWTLAIPPASTLKRSSAMPDKNMQDFNVYASVWAGSDERGRPQYKKGGRIGVAWWHNDKREGLNVILDGLPPSGRLVMFVHDPNWKPEEASTPAVEMAADA